MQADLAFTAMGIDPSVSNITDQYLGYLCFGFPAIISYLALRGLSEGMRATRPIMLVNLAALVINIPLNYAFIYGKWGAPEMGLNGAGLATFLARMIGVVVVGWYVLYSKLLWLWCWCQEIPSFFFIVSGA